MNASLSLLISSLSLSLSLLGTFLMVVTFTYGVMTCSRIPRAQDFKLSGSPGTQTFLLVVLTFIFGIELGFKLASKQTLYLLNPCHVLTAAQVSSVYVTMNLVIAFAVLFFIAKRSN